MLSYRERLFRQLLNSIGQNAATRETSAAAEALEFEKAAELRDSIAQIEAELAA